MDQHYEISEYARLLERELHLPVPIRIVTDQDAGHVEGLSQHAVAWYCPSSDEISLNQDKLSAICSEGDYSLRDILGQSIFHEAVGHYGLRLLLGEKFEQTMEYIYEHAVPELREKLLVKRAQLEEMKDARGKNLHRGMPERFMKILTVEEYMSDRAEHLHDFPPHRRRFLTWLAQGLGNAMKSMGFSFFKVREKDIDILLEHSYRKVRSRGVIARQFDHLEQRWPQMRNPFVRHTLQSKNIQKGLAPDTPKPPSLKGKILKSFFWVVAPYIMVLKSLAQRNKNFPKDKRDTPAIGRWTDKRPISREVLNDLASQRLAPSKSAGASLSKPDESIIKQRKSAQNKNDDLTMTI